MVQNGGNKLTPLYCDENLLERLRFLVTDTATNAKVRKKAQGLYIGWAQNFKGVRGYERLVALYKQVPVRSRKPRPQPKYLSNDLRDLEEDEDEDEERERSHGSNDGQDSRRRNNNHNDYYDDNAGEGSSRGSHRPPPVPPSSAKPSKGKKKPLTKSNKSAPAPMPKINLIKERPLIQRVLADSGTASTNLINALTLINWERELSTENKAATDGFKRCRTLRKSVLRYIHSIESDEFLGPLIHANEELITALKKYDEMSRPPDYDSDSEDSDYDKDDWKVEADRMQHLNIGSSSKNAGTSRSRSGSLAHNTQESSTKKQQQYSESETESEDDNNPFGDSNAI